ncbi:MAG: ABC transporter substrate-binding protein [Actinotignum sanguinis]|uniref:heme/hemin ABC transporter substrate-binding protein n=1 Tax=Actinotignum sanguinis TaxID=1445614 RepID=UPI00254A5126|nr:ABC transporter substrate-binding protein [Actinotignum sanguinis]MDK8286468.1 ABC transporter substrate-binding protein [Actinotignum sanguinis]MDK8353480.1 ABC transporter substrate-binding protein [Actinotignum sanguinis]MDK8651820.1 ABC transporter substrate-binding protein [Actinotignum sanguinis]MDK8802263.1 ABC transporter substrate-binding protein [Actinotignum sanguinis]
MKRWGALCAVLTLALSACGTTATTEGQAPQQPGASAAEAGATAPTPTTAAPVSDPRSLTGMATVAPLPEPHPTVPAAVNLPVTITDASGAKVTVTDASRVVTLDMSAAISQTLLALGLGHTIAGRTISDTEPSLASVPVVTESGHTVNAEAVLRLAPTLILTDGTIRGAEGALAQLEASGIPVVRLSRATTFDDAPSRAAEVARAVGAGQAGEELAAQISQSIAQARIDVAQLAPADPLRMVFLNIRPQAGLFMLLGSESGASDVIDAVGGHDMAGEAGVTQARPASQEALLVANPEVIIVMTNGLSALGGIEALEGQPGISQTEAGKKQRVLAIPDNLSLGFGPQSGDLIRAMGQALYTAQ